MDYVINKLIGSSLANFLKRFIVAHSHHTHKLIELERHEDFSLVSQGQQGQSDFKPNDFQKFGEVTNDTDIYFVKTSDEGNTYFASDDTTLKFAAAQV